MATRDQYEDAARKPASQRTSHEQSLVDKGLSSGMQSVRNAVHETERRERTYGKHFW